jgi:agmatine deiminase
MLWPERPDIWPFGGKPAQQAFTRIASTIAQYEPVTVAVSKAQFKNARHRLPPCIRVIEMSYDGCWIRDTGPTFVIDDQARTRGVDWIFNAWGGLDGGLYFPWDQDDLVASKILEIERAPRYRPELVLEGGAINVDGKGTLLTTEECILNPNRNPTKTKSQIESLLKTYLNVSTIIWVPRGLAQDEAGGHIDNICSFVRPGVVVLAWTDNDDDPQYERCREAYSVLASSRDARGSKLEIEKLLLPEPIYIPRDVSEAIDAVPPTVPRLPGDKLPASYINFLVRPGNLWVELGSSLALSEEAVEFTAGGVEGALVVFRAIMNERSAVLMDHAT